MEDNINIILSFFCCVIVPIGLITAAAIFGTKYKLRYAQKLLEKDKKERQNKKGNQHQT